METEKSLEEKAKEYFPYTTDRSLNMINNKRIGFILGFKQAQSEMYSKEQLVQKINEFIEAVIVNRRCAIAEWFNQQKF